MSKLADNPIMIVLDKGKQTPTAFGWRGRVYNIIAVQECWRLIGAWWNGEGERTLFRVVVENGGIFELYYDHGKQRWFIERVED
jgi:hypothetical protein